MAKIGKSQKPAPKKVSEHIRRLREISRLFEKVEK